VRLSSNYRVYQCLLRRPVDEQNTVQKRAGGIDSDIPETGLWDIVFLSLQFMNSLVWPDGSWFKCSRGTGAIGALIQKVIEFLLLFLAH